MSNGKLSKNVISVVVSLLTVICLSALAYANVPAGAVTEGNARVAESYGKLPIAFEANEGQTDPKVKYFARGQGYTLFMTPQEFVLSMSSHVKGKDKVKTAVVAMKFINPGADAKTITGIDELPGKSNYFIGNDPQKWRTNVPTYQKVKYEEVYPGVDLVVYGNQRQIEYDFVVGPHADYKKIAFKVEGAKKLKTDKDGNLIIAAKGGKMLMHKPLVYQEIDGVRQEIKGRYAVGKGNLVSFNVAAYDKNKELVIDPTLTYSTYLGGSGNDQAWSIAVDSSGYAYVAGSTNSTNFPTTTGALKTTFDAGYYDVFVTKLNQTGTALVYSTYLGGSGDDYAYSIAVDSSGYAYVAGRAGSTNFPTTTGVLQTTFSGYYYNAFVTKLNQTGTALVYSTYLGGSGGDYAYSIAVDSSGYAYVAGRAGSTNFPTTTGVLQTTFSGYYYNAFVTKLNQTGTALVYSTYLGGSRGDYVYSIAVDSSGYAYVAGYTYSSNFPTTTGAYQTTYAGGYYDDAFVTKLNQSGTALVYSTYLGGSGGGFAHSIAVDSSGYAYVAGSTSSTDFPTTTGAYQTTLVGGSDAFVTKLNQSGTALVYSTYLGGGSSSDASYVNSIAVDSSGYAYVAGYTSGSFPTTTGAYQTTYASSGDAFVTKLNQSGTALVYSTYLGGSGSDMAHCIAVDSSGSVYVAGDTSSSNFPTTTGAYQITNAGGSSDAFVTKMAMAASSTYALTVTKSGTGSGTVTPSSGTLSWSGSTGTASYTSGTSVVLTATAASGSTFSSWSGCDFTNAGQCTITMSSNKSVSATFATSGSSDYDAASAEITALYNQYASFLGTKSGGIVTGTSGSASYYVQWFTNGAALVAWTDGTMFTYYNGNWYALGVTWKTSGTDLDKATTAINSIYSQYASLFGSKSGSIVTGTSGSATYYVQWVTSGAAIVAWTDGTIYVYYNSTWYALGVSWK
ncbi:SBBP repeat-containing protein [Candidatus Magnetominusculus dajiuhuensis]|uniref:SBBP repeat-containing protein n=1 Tax=Candidatus Magnetominusculus dajiuhuensis TaxID=3137712 RepID=UPI003B4284C8